MATKTRKIVEIDEELCDGCGDCIMSCAEGAIQIIDGKAKLVSDNLCDGFGNCLGTCPQDAIKIIEREAVDFDEAAVEKHLAGREDSTPVPAPQPLTVAYKAAPAQPRPVHGCPGSAMRSFEPVEEKSAGESSPAGELPSKLTQWPVQLMLVPPTAPFLNGRDLLLAADCCPFAYADFHRKYLAGKALLVGCPKLDNLQFYREKMEAVFRDSGCTSVTVMIMEVPCCGGLNMIAREALAASGRDIPYREIVVGIRGNILSDRML